LAEAGCIAFHAAAQAKAKAPAGDEAALAWDGDMVKVSMVFSLDRQYGFELSILFKLGYKSSMHFI